MAHDGIEGRTGHRVGAHLVGARPDSCHFGVTPAHPEGPPRRGQGPAPWPRLRPDEEAMPGSTHLGRLTVPRLRGSSERGLIGLVAAPTTTSAVRAMAAPDGGPDDSHKVRIRPSRKRLSDLDRGVQLVLELPV